jgi:hypothetical protein
VCYATQELIFIQLPRNIYVCYPRVCLFSVFPYSVKIIIWTTIMIIYVKGTQLRSKSLHSKIYTKTIWNTFKGKICKKYNHEITYILRKSKLDCYFYFLFKMFKYVSFKDHFGYSNCAKIVNYMFGLLLGYKLTIILMWLV